MKTKLIGTGFSGLVGSRAVALLQDAYEIEDISRKTGIDIADREAVINRIVPSSAEYVIHMAAYTDVEGAEQEKDLKEKSFSWQINVTGTQHVVNACERAKKKLIYISTDMVFPGDKPLGQTYNETDERGPVNWYAMTKYMGEKVVEQARIPWTIIRIAYPYRANFEKKEYVRIFLSLLQQGKHIEAVVDHYYTPTFIDDIAGVFDAIIKKQATGIFHAGSSQPVNPYDVAVKVAEVFGLDKDLIEKTTREAFFKNRAKRPFNLSLNSAKIATLGVRLHSFDEGLQEIKKQITL
ncbi:MAG TPA: NAD(P)-dependent oxidoreductase [Patescibacteria group bacterium]|nr:NAD(P)-dependent oxidoreductase [Patescibacteria group bacterium]